MCVRKKTSMFPILDTNLCITLSSYPLALLSSAFASCCVCSIDRSVSHWKKARRLPHAPAPRHRSCGVRSPGGSRLAAEFCFTTGFLLVCTATVYYCRHCACRRRKPPKQLAFFLSPIQHHVRGKLPLDKSTLYHRKSSWSHTNQNARNLKHTKERLFQIYFGEKIDNPRILLEFFKNSDRNSVVVSSITLYLCSIEIFLWPNVDFHGVVGNKHNRNAGKSIRIPRSTVFSDKNYEWVLIYVPTKYFYGLMWTSVASSSSYGARGLACSWQRRRCTAARCGAGGAAAALPSHQVVQQCTQLLSVCV